LSLYRSRVFPAVEEAGFIPITADDVISPGDNVNAKIDTLVDRAAVMVVELTSSWTRAELEMAIARNRLVEIQGKKRRGIRIIAVVAEDEQPAGVPQAVKIINKSDLLTDDIDGFVEDLVTALRSFPENAFSADEADRLLNAREYRAPLSLRFPRSKRGFGSDWIASNSP
jgi:hypothetical protein